MKNDYPYLRDINFPVLNSSNVDLLIRINNADLLLQRDFDKVRQMNPLQLKLVLDEC